MLTTLMLIIASPQEDWSPKLSASIDAWADCVHERATLNGGLWANFYINEAAEDAMKHCAPYEDVVTLIAEDESTTEGPREYFKVMKELDEARGALLNMAEATAMEVRKREETYCKEHPNDQDRCW